MRKIKRADSVHAKAQKFVREESPPVPYGITLNDDELIIWDSFTRARAREDWREMDLILLAKVVTIENNIRQNQQALNEQGVLIENQKGTPIENPLLRVVDTLQRQQLSVIRTIKRLLVFCSIKCSFNARFTLNHRLRC